MPEDQPTEPMLIQLPSAFGDASTNMAVDAALLETIPEGLALFRHYGWLEPAATFGYAQRYSDVQSTLEASSEAAPIASLIRRLTGGGIVDHRNDWTYALLLHRSLRCTNSPATQLYKELHEAVSHVLTSMEIPTKLAPCPRRCPNPVSQIPNPVSQFPNPESRIPHPASRISNPASHCFTTPAADDVLLPDGRKVAGAAMKRTKKALLIQGSISRATLPDSFEFAAFQTAFVGAISRQLALSSGALEDIRPLFNAQRIATLRTQFQTDTWNQRR